MSGYCLECGNDLCICHLLRLETEKAVNVNDIIKKLKEENGILKEALEFVVKESGLSANYNKVAREALAKVEE